MIAVEELDPMDRIAEDSCCDCDRCCASRRTAAAGEYVWSVCSFGGTVRSAAPARQRQCWRGDGSRHKRAYKSRSAARNALRKQQTAGLGNGCEVYRCEVCRSYHIGKPVQEER